MLKNITRILLLLSLGLAVYLAWHGLSSSAIAGCGAGSGCDEVLNSEWSIILGVPVGVFAVLAYGLMLGLTFALPKADQPQASKPLAASLLCVLAIATAAGIFWFVGLQAFVIRAFCLFCLIDHALGLLSCVLVLRLVWAIPGGTLRRSGMAGLSAAGLIMAGMFAGVQVLLLPDTYAVDDVQVSETVTAEAGRVIALGEQGQYRFRIGELPILGDPSAEHIIMVMSDYLCPKCQEMSKKLAAALDLYGDQLAVVYIPVPLNSDCNPYYSSSKQFVSSCEISKLVLAVGHIDRKAFSNFHRWLIDQSPDAALAKRYAQKLVGADQLEQVMSSGWADRQLEINVSAYGGGALPRLYVGSKKISGTPSTPEELFTILENYSLKPKGSDTSESE